MSLQELQLLFNSTACEVCLPLVFCAAFVTRVCLATSYLHLTIFTATVIQLRRYITYIESREGFLPCLALDHPINLFSKASFPPFCFSVQGVWERLGRSDTLRSTTWPRIIDVVKSGLGEFSGWWSVVLYVNTWIIYFSLMDQQETSENPDEEIEFLEDDFEEVVDFGDEGDNGEGI